jgi:DNA mismatch repair ATPase MutS
MGFTEIQRAGELFSKQSVRAQIEAKTLSNADGQLEIVFLYKLLPSLSHRSFGTYVGRLAGLPQAVLERADRQSGWMREKVKDQWINKLARRLGQKVFAESEIGRERTVQSVIEALREAKGMDGQV